MPLALVTASRWVLSEKQVLVFLVLAVEATSSRSPASAARERALSPHQHLAQGFLRLP